MNLPYKNLQTDILKNHDSADDPEIQYGIKYRRLQSILSASGFGVIIFGVWSIIKILLQLLFGSEALSQGETLPSEMLSDVDESALNRLLLIFLALIIIVLLIEIGLRIYVGLSARAEARGKKKSIAYIIIAGIIIPYFALSLIFDFTNFNYLDGHIFDTIITMILDVSSLISVVELFVSAIRFRKMRKNAPFDVT